MAIRFASTATVKNKLPRTSNFWNGTTPQPVAADPGAMFPLGMVQVGSGGASSVTFSSIPNTYKHLQIRIMSRTARTDVNDLPQLQFNSDSGSNYIWHYFQGDGSSAAAGSGTSQTSIWTWLAAGGNSPSNVFGAQVIDILDYSNTTKNKVTRNLGGVDNNGSGAINLTSGLWLNTAAINNITIYKLSGTNFSQYSSFALYGIKGA